MRAFKDENTPPGAFGCNWIHKGTIQTKSFHIKEYLNPYDPAGRYDHFHTPRRAKTKRPQRFAWGERQMVSQRQLPNALRGMWSGFKIMNRTDEEIAANKFRNIIVAVHAINMEREIFDWPLNVKWFHDAKAVLNLQEDFDGYMSHMEQNDGGEA